MRSRVALAFAVLAGCTDASPLPGLPAAQEKVEQFDVLATRPMAIDVLFVVDRSPALDAYRDVLRTQLGYAGAELAMRRDHDLHLGVVGAAADDGPGSFLPEITNPRGERIGFSGDLAHALPDMVLLPPRADGDAHLFDATLRALHGNPGFRRDGAGLIIVMLAAGDDDSVVGPDELSAELHAQVPGFAAFVLIATPDPVLGPRWQALTSAMPSRAIGVRFDELESVNSYAPYLPFGPRSPGDPCAESVIDEASCAFSDVTGDDERLLHACADDPALPCWRFQNAPMYCPVIPRELVIDRAYYPPAGTHVRGQCVVP